jgi:hypothetical protein
MLTPGEEGGQARGGYLTFLQKKSQNPHPWDKACGQKYQNFPTNVTMCVQKSKHT